ncbi:ciliogenesis-associated TTC17-interacting protein isoform X3 [Xiphophorus hellerii]|uniref:ciliogenesis-associated TTC17-interacting protein isoform X3 n=1 Tax=Xiphophorus hellerii TaxID=8084 RepID=UPI0013B42244|nr:ciliogenesis-associated TTC17-interacting protein isoform X3 [Xiphophorus hellerii]
MEEDDVPAVATESQPEEELEAAAEESKHEEESKASEEAVAEESRHDDESKASEEAVAEESKHDDESKASEEAVAEEFKVPDEAVSGESKPEEEFKASEEAVNFLTSIEPEELQKCVFSESLLVMSDCGGVLGEFSMSMELTHRALEPCVILHARSHGAIDGSPCGTTVTAYLTADLEVLEEDYHEYVKLDSYSVEKKCHMAQRDEQMVINKITAMGEDVTEEECVSYPMSVLRGLVTEGSSMLLMRLMALRKKVPKNMVFIILDRSLHITQTTFRELAVKKIQVHGETVEVFGLERMVCSADGDHPTWHSYFLNNGYLASRKQVGSPVTMKVIRELSKKDRVLSDSSCSMLVSEPQSTETRCKKSFLIIKVNHVTFHSIYDYLIIQCTPAHLRFYICGFADFSMNFKLFAKNVPIHIFFHRRICEHF